MGGPVIGQCVAHEGFFFNHKRFHETSKGLRNLLMYNLLPQLQRCRRSFRKTKTLQTDKSTHKYTLILLHIINMPKTSLEIAIRLIFHDFLTHGRERVKKSCKIKRIAISKLVLGILIMCDRISVYLCVDLSVCKFLIFRKLLIHLWSYGNKLYIKKFLKPLEVS